ncbi:MAG: TIGR00266 family protein [Cyanobacteriota bacterium]
MNYEITGVIAQVVNVELERGEFCWISPGGMVSFKGGIDWTMKVPGGISGALNRMMSGETLRMTYVQCKGRNGNVTFNNSLPGKVYPWDLKKGDIITTRGSFLGAVGDIDIKVTVAKKIGAAAFGGAGLILQTISGTGTVFVHGFGDFIEYDLAQDESLNVSTGNLSAFDKCVDYDIQSVGSIGKTLFGGEGLFMTKLTGPGKVLLQSMKKGSGGGAAMAALGAFS